MTCTAVDNIPEVAYDILNNIGIPSHLKGYNYMADAITIAANDPTKLDAITKVLYPEVAKDFGTTPSRVERAMRHSIEVVFSNTDLQVLYKYFGNSISTMKGKVTNSQFVATLSRVVRKQLVAQG